MRQAFQVSSPGRLRDDWCFARVPRPAGGVAEWFKAHAWKACIRETVSRVRIPPPPPAPFGIHGSRFNPETWVTILARRGVAGVLVCLAPRKGAHGRNRIPACPKA